mgnify:CR=1 FL=1
MPDASMSDDSRLVLDAVDKFLEKDVAPYVRNLEAADEYPTQVADKLAELGVGDQNLFENCRARRSRVDVGVRYF